MRLKVLLPFQIFLDQVGVSRIVAQTANGALGLLEQRLDCVAALPPGILAYTLQAGAEQYLAVDEGILVKTGDEVCISVRHAVAGVDLASLHEAVKRDFLALDAQEKSVRAVMTKLETGFVRRYAAFHHGR